MNTSFELGREEFSYDNEKNIEDTDEALYTPSQEKIVIESDVHIIFSPTYKTPVVYFNLYEGL